MGHAGAPRRSRPAQEVIITDRELYLNRAAGARAEADKAQLSNVRDTCLRAEAAWMAMADRALKVDGMRERLLADKKRAAALVAAPIE